MAMWLPVSGGTAEITRSSLLLGAHLITDINLPIAESVQRCQGSLRLCVQQQMHPPICICLTP